MRGSRPSLPAASAAASRCSREVASNAMPRTVALARECLARDLDAFGGELELAHENARHVAPGTREVRHVALGERIEIDGQKYDGSAVRNRERGAQRALVAHRQEHVDLARRKLAIVFFVALEIRGLD